MNPLTDDPLDTELRAALHGIEGRSPLSVDVDTVIARGRSRRRAVVAERVLAVVAVLAVVVGATVFAVRSSSGREVVLGPVPPSGTSSPSSDALSLVVDLNGGGNEPGVRRTVTQMFLLHNGTRARLTITGWRVVDATGAVKGALADPIKNGAVESLTMAAQRALLSGPARSTVTLEPDEEVNLVLQLTATCTAADEAIQPTVEFDLRGDDGTTGRTVIAPNAFANLPGAPPNLALGWVSSVVRSACGGELPYATPTGPPLGASPRPTFTAPSSSPTMTSPQLVIQGAGSFHDKRNVHVGITDLELYNPTGRSVVITDLEVSDRTRSTKATLDAVLPTGTGMGVGVNEWVVLAAPALRTATIPAGAAIKVVLSIHAGCTTADKQIQPAVTLHLRWDDGTTGQTVITPLDGYSAGYGEPLQGWVAVTIAQACARS